MSDPLPRLMIAGTASGVGKTTLTLGLMSALRASGRTVQPYKVGPDYLDPSHHSAICGRPSRNLDSWMCSGHLPEILNHGSSGADISIVEGVMGLFDGLRGDADTASSAEVAKQLDIPVILVVNAKAMARSLAATVHGFATFDPAVRLAGVIANHVSGPSHFEYLSAACRNLPVPLLGWLPPDDSLCLPDRHLGLVSPHAADHREVHQACGEFVSHHLDINTLAKLAATAGPTPPANSTLFENKNNRPWRLALARDKAFHFYYEDNLDIMRARGADIVEFSPLTDPTVPDADIVYLGGGYPEAHAVELAANTGLLDSLKTHVTRRPLLAECGGMMLLAQELETLDGTRHPMAGLHPGSVRMTPKRRALGYVDIELLKDSPLGSQGTELRGHQFRYSELTDNPECPASSLTRPAKGTTTQDGYADNTVHCGYAHWHLASNPTVADNLAKCSS